MIAEERLAGDDVRYVLGPCYSALCPAAALRHRWRHRQPKAAETETSPTIESATLGFATSLLAQLQFPGNDKRHNRPPWQERAQQDPLKKVL